MLCARCRAAGLDAESQLTYDIFKRERDLAVESFTYPSELHAGESVPIDAPGIRAAPARASDPTRS